MLYCYKKTSALFLLILPSKLCICINSMKIVVFLIHSTTHNSQLAGLVLPHRENSGQNKSPSLFREAFHPFWPRKMRSPWMVAGNLPFLARQFASLYFRLGTACLVLKPPYYKLKYIHCIMFCNSLSPHAKILDRIHSVQWWSFTIFPV